MRLEGVEDWEERRATGALDLAGALVLAVVVEVAGGVVGLVGSATREAESQSASLSLGMYNHQKIKVLSSPAYTRCRM